MDSGGPELDPERLEELRSLDGTGALLAEVIETLQQTCGRMLEDLREQLELGQVDRARDTAHTLAGRALLVGARRAVVAVRALERDLVAGELGRARSRWPGVQQAFTRAQDALAAYQDS